MAETFVDPVGYEVVQEKAAELARTEKRFVAALDRYRQQARDSIGEQREHIVWELVDATTAFVVHREACGLRDPHYVFDLYGVPAEAVARIGVRRRSGSR
jgi:hypothetical protein